MRVEGPVLFVLSLFYQPKRCVSVRQSFITYDYFQIMNNLTPSIDSQPMRVDSLTLLVLRYPVFTYFSQSIGHFFLKKRTKHVLLNVSVPASVRSPTSGRNTTTTPPLPPPPPPARTTTTTTATATTATTRGQGRDRGHDRGHVRGRAAGADRLHPEHRHSHQLQGQRRHNNIMIHTVC